MGGATNKLTDMALKIAKPGTATRRLADGGGLFLEIRPNGSKYWRMAYRFGGKQKLLALGVYPNVSMPEARKAAQQAHQHLGEGRDPGLVKKITKGTNCTDNTFQAVALEWLEKFKHQWSDSHVKSISGRLQRDIFPWIGSRPIGEITPPELLSVLRRIEARGHLENTHRALTNAGQVFMYALATGRIERNPASDLKGAIPRPTVKHMSSIIDPDQVGELMRAIDRYSGSPITRCALQLTAHVFLRSKEIRLAEWSEIDFDKLEWRIPIAKMKGNKRDKEANPAAYHLVPLATQVINILREVQALSGQGKYLFPGLRSNSKPISDATLTNALRRMGYSQEELHVHGLRATARTLIRQELGFDEEPIERQLGHAVKGPLGAAYNRADFVEERKKMMQAWADYLDKLKAVAEIIPIRAAVG
ncbi:MAG: tyrosine-type recombinase/integrase [Desulfobulbaceae bacterium]|nr:tyrosine-type recombinase/integrase [Desulfobulbaceae bacterium]